MEVISQEVLDKLRRLMDARIERDEDKKAAENSEAVYREIEAEVHAALADGPVERLNNIDLGPPHGKVSFHAKSTTYGRIINDEKAQEYFEGRAMVDEVSKPKFVMQRINEIVRELDENDQPMPPGVDFYKRRFIQITKQKGS
jgi:hypothetical protein